MNEQDRVEKALNTLAEMCDAPPIDPNHDMYGARLEQRNQRIRAAEEILSHHREESFSRTLKEIAITLNVNGAIPVRPMTRSEVTNAGE